MHTWTDPATDSQRRVVSKITPAILKHFAFPARKDWQWAHGQGDQDYDAAIRLEPKNAAAYNNRATAYDEIKKHDKAISDYNKAIKLDPNFASVYHNRGITYRKQGKDAWAQADFDKAKQLGYRGSQ
jgi:tetratricopeptide (TPR) repeat protein